MYVHIRVWCELQYLESDILMQNPGLPVIGSLFLSSQASTLHYHQITTKTIMPFHSLWIGLHMVLGWGSTREP